jgi:hypothetical protein
MASTVRGILHSTPERRPLAPDSRSARRYCTDFGLGSKSPKPTVPYHITTSPTVGRSHDNSSLTSLGSTPQGTHSPTESDTSSLGVLDLEFPEPPAMLENAFGNIRRAQSTPSFAGEQADESYASGRRGHVEDYPVPSLPSDIKPHPRTVGPADLKWNKRPRLPTEFFDSEQDQIGRQNAMSREAELELEGEYLIQSVDDIPPPTLSPRRPLHVSAISAPSASTVMSYPGHRHAESVPSSAGFATAPHVRPSHIRAVSSVGKVSELRRGTPPHTVRRQAPLPRVPAAVVNPPQPQHQQVQSQVQPEAPKAVVKTRSLKFAPDTAESQRHLNVSMERVKGAGQQQSQGPGSVRNLLKGRSISMDFNAKRAQAARTALAGEQYVMVSGAVPPSSYERHQGQQGQRHHPYNPQPQLQQQPSRHKSCNVGPNRTSLESPVPMSAGPGQPHRDWHRPSISQDNIHIQDHQPVQINTHHARKPSAHNQGHRHNQARGHGQAHLRQPSTPFLHHNPQRPHPHSYSQHPASTSTHHSANGGASNSDAARSASRPSYPLTVSMQSYIDISADDDNEVEQQHATKTRSLRSLFVRASSALRLTKIIKGTV